MAIQPPEGTEGDSHQHHRNRGRDTHTKESHSAEVITKELHEDACAGVQKQPNQKQAARFQMRTWFASQPKEQPENEELSKRGIQRGWVPQINRPRQRREPSETATFHQAPNSPEHVTHRQRGSE